MDEVAVALREVLAVVNQSRGNVNGYEVIRTYLVKAIAAREGRSTLTLAEEQTLRAELQTEKSRADALQAELDAKEPR